MSQERKRLEEDLLLYGADLQQWPEGIKEHGLQILEQFPELQSLVDEHRQFEMTLKDRAFEEPAHDLEERIIKASLRPSKETTLSFRNLFAESFAWLGLAQPRFAVISLLLVFILGILIGLVDPVKLLASQTMEITLSDHLTLYGGAL